MPAWYEQIGAVRGPAHTLLWPAPNDMNKYLEVTLPLASGKVGNPGYRVLFGGWDPTSHKVAHPQLALDIDWHAGRAAATWLPTGATGVQPGVPPFHREIAIDHGFTDTWPDIPAREARTAQTNRITGWVDGQWITGRMTSLVMCRVARIEPGHAITAARQYITTGHRPTCLDWPTEATAGPL